MDQLTSDGACESCLQSNISGQRQKTNSFFNVPGLFVGLSPKSVLDCDSVRSPTSPLDFVLLSNLSTSLRFLKSSQDCGHQKSWDCVKVGLGSIVDSLDDDDDDDDRNLPEKAIPSSNSKTILFGSQIRSKTPNSPTCAHFCEAPKSLPKNYAIFPHAKMRPSNLEKGGSDVIFEIGEDPLEADPFVKIQSFSLDSKRLGSEISKLSTRITDLRTENFCFGSGTIQGHRALSLIAGSSVAENKLTPDSMPINSGNGFARSLTPSEIELSEDYTRVIAHGPNPKTTHIFGDCVLECHPDGIDFGNKRESSENGMPSLEIPSPLGYPPNDFLSYCDFCKKKLEEGKDIYMYRGEKAFCSWDCRMEEISMEEQKEKSSTEASREPSNSENGNEGSEKSMFFAI